MLTWNAGYRLAGAGDHLPIPPAPLIRLVPATPTLPRFCTRRTSADVIRYVLRRNNCQLEGFTNVLDFGCGCGGFCAAGRERVAHDSLKRITILFWLIGAGGIWRRLENSVRTGLLLPYPCGQ